jgi:hypothetical protein
VWSVTIGAYMSIGRTMTPFCEAYADYWRVWRVIFAVVGGFAGVVLILMLVAYATEPSVGVDISFVVMATMAGATAFLYAPLMGKYARAKLVRLAAEERRCFHCGASLDEEPSGHVTTCPSRTRRGAAQRRRELAARRPKASPRVILGQIRRAGWWWYVLLAILVMWSLLDTNWFKSEFEALTLPLALASPVVLILWMLGVVPFLEARRTQFGKRGDMERGGMVTPSLRYKWATGVVWYFAALSAIGFVFIGPTLARVIDDLTFSFEWSLVSPPVGSLLLVLWAAWATPRLERRVRRSARQALVCFECGADLQGVTASTCPECDVEIDRPAACPFCRYDISHLTGDTCPECGRAVLPPRRSTGHAHQGG